MPDLPEDMIDPFGLDEDRRLSKPCRWRARYLLYRGFEMLLCTDEDRSLRFASGPLIEVKRGIYPVGGATVRMFEELGWVTLCATWLPVTR